MKVADAMVRRMISVTPETTIFQAARLMSTAQISGLPVVDFHGDLVGIVTEGDFLRRTELGTERRRPAWREFLVGAGKLAEEFTRSHGRKVREIMTREVHTIAEESPLADAVDLMERSKVKRLPVVKDGKLVGMLTRSNFVNAILSRSSTEKSQHASDWSIREQIISALEKQPWSSLRSLEVAVDRAKVRISGIIFDEREDGALKVLAENIPGVQAVETRLMLVEPRTGIAVYDDRYSAR